MDIFDADFSLRDWFAGQSLPIVLDQQMTNSSEAIKVAFRGEIPSQADMDEIGAHIRKQTAENCYKIADAMLTARKESNP